MDKQATDHPVPAYLASLARQGIAAGIGWALGKHLIPASMSGDLEALGVALVPVLWGLYTQHANAKKLNAAKAS